MGLARFRDWIVAQAAFGVLGALRLLPADTALNLMARLGRRIGPKLRRNRLVLTALRNAFPEKSEAEIAALALESWENLGRMAAEYVFFDRLFDFDPARPGAGRVELQGIEHLPEPGSDPRPFIFFTAHTGCFEMLPHAAAAMGLPVAVLFRPPNNRFIAERLMRLRGVGSGRLVPSHAGSSLVLARQLAAGKGIGILVDQKFLPGVEARFFGLPAFTNPLVARLAKQFDCTVLPARCVRLAGNRYRIIVEPPFSLPRDGEGEIDAAAAVQAINDKVESWVREYPEQWLWYHDRWNIKHGLR